MAKRKKEEAEEAGGERWLVSYADFLTLLFAFFTTLYAISTVDQQKMGKMVTSMRESFDSNLFPPGSQTLSLNSGAGNNPSSREILQSMGIQGMNSKSAAAQSGKLPSKRQVLSGGAGLARLKGSIDSLLKEEVLKGRVRTRIDARGLIISLGEGGVFDSGSDQIKAEGRALLDGIASRLVSVGNQIRIEGHTDNMPISNDRFPSNWELSTARATTVLRYLISQYGLQPELSSAAGFADTRPTNDNSTEEGKARNRRVDVVVLNTVAAQLEPR